MTTDQTRQIFRDLYMPLRPEYHFLSPLYGVLWCNNEIAEKYYRFLGVDHPIGLVARALFYRTDLVEFDVSKEVKNPFTWFSTATLARVMAFMSRPHFTDDDVAELFQYVRDDADFHDAVEQQHLLSVQIQRLCDSVLQRFENTKTQIAAEESEALTLSAHLKAQEKTLNQILQQAENASKAQQEKIHQLRSAIAALKNGKKILGKSAVENKEVQLLAINTEIAELETRLSAAQQGALHQADLLPAWQNTQTAVEHARLQKDAATQRASELVDNFTESTVEQLRGEGFSTDFIARHLPFNKYHRYLPRRVQDYISIHCTDRDSLLVELHNLCRLLVIASRTTGHDRDAIHLLNAALWLKCKGDLSKLTAYMLQLQALRTDLFADVTTDETRFPDLCHEYYDREVYGRYFPPLCITKTCRPTPDSEVSFSDCGESSLRNFINVLVKNQDTAQLDAGILKRSGLAVDPRVIAFYEKNPSLETIRSLDVHNQWAEIASSLNARDSRIKYLTPGKDAYCELAAGGNNMLHMLQALLGEADITAICRQISSTSGIDIRCDLREFHPERHDLEDFTNVVHLEFNGKYIFHWYFLKQHFRCASADLFNEEENYVRQALDTLNAEMKQRSLDRDQFRALLSFFLKEKPVVQVKTMFNDLGAALIGDEMTFLMLAKLNSVDSMFDYCMNVLTIPTLAHSEPISATITAIIQGISPHPVIFEQRKNLIERIIDCGVTSLIDLANRWEKECLEPI
ncbi:MAG: hypothetical protein ACRC7D_16070 [Aeromonas popoffii]|uniref:hypothetical protein n=1 Tax=Aeromonas popoffii TaxID=70856 RepID=UPI003F2E9CB8